MVDTIINICKLRETSGSIVLYFICDMLLMNSIPNPAKKKSVGLWTARPCFVDAALCVDKYSNNISRFFFVPICPGLV